MIYIIDGYNIIHKIKTLEAALDRDLRAAREALIALCCSLIERNGSVQKIVLVFDGKSEFCGLPHPSLPKIELVFSETGQEADEKIIEVMEAYGKTSRKCVVSDDNFVRNQARAWQTAAMTAAEFEKLAFLRPASKPAQPGRPGSPLPQHLADQITAEYKKQLGLS